MTSRHYSSDAKEMNILIAVHCFNIGVKLGVFNIACSFNSFEQCSNIHTKFFLNHKKEIIEYTKINENIPLKISNGRNFKLLAVIIFNTS